MALRARGIHASPSQAVSHVPMQECTGPMQVCKSSAKILTSRSFAVRYICITPVGNPNTTTDGQQRCRSPRICTCPGPTGSYPQSPVIPHHKATTSRVREMVSRMRLTSMYLASSSGLSQKQSRSRDMAVPRALRRHLGMPHVCHASASHGYSGNRCRQLSTSVAPTRKRWPPACERSECA